MSNNCLLCGTIASVNHDDDDYLEQRFNYNCPNCGKYSASDIFIKLACLSEEEKKLLSKFIKSKNIEKNYDLLITEQNYQHIISDAMEATGDYSIYDKK